LLGECQAGACFELSGLVVNYGSTKALAGVSLRLDPGDQVALVGPSGSGKTTLLSLLNATVRANGGSILLNDVDLTALSVDEMRQARSRIAFIHQGLNLIPNIRVLHNVLSGRLGRQSFLGSLYTMLLPGRQRIEAVHEILERVGIADKLYEYTHRLSGGQQQRVAIARALYQDCRAILADEPVSSVDPARARDLVVLLTSIARESGLTLVMSLHNLELAQAYFPRLVGLRQGEVAFDAPTADVSSGQLRALYDLSMSQPVA
jgi:phosphonate transport system ATP-binding protein